MPEPGSLGLVLLGGGLTALAARQKAPRTLIPVDPVFEKTQGPDTLASGRALDDSSAGKLDQALAFSSAAFLTTSS